MLFLCDSCQGKVVADDSELGQKIRCEKCQCITTVPSNRLSQRSVIGDFALRKELGRGGGGVVYLADQLSFNRLAAVKILPVGLAENNSYIKAFVKEARLAAKLSHPHFAQALAVGEDEGLFYFAMEYIDGIPLSDALQRYKKIPFQEAILSIMHIADALEYAWKEAGIIHKDIKPENIMVTTKGSTKLVDLGLALKPNEVIKNDPSEFRGSPMYMSPEHFLENKVDMRSDIYSLGATFYALVTGQVPFPSQTYEDAAKAHIKQHLIPPHKIDHSIPLAVSLIISKMMKKNPDERFQTPLDLLKELRNFRMEKQRQGVDIPMVVTLDPNGLVTPTSNIERRVLSVGDAGKKKDEEKEERPEEIQDKSIGAKAKTLFSRKKAKKNTSDSISGENGYLTQTTNLLKHIRDLRGIEIDEEIPAGKKKKFYIALGVYVVAIIGGHIAWFMTTPAALPKPSTALLEEHNVQLDRKTLVQRVNYLMAIKDQHTRIFVYLGNDLLKTKPSVLTKTENFSLKMLEAAVNKEEKPNTLKHIPYALADALKLQSYTLSR